MGKLQVKYRDKVWTDESVKEYVMLVHGDDIDISTARRRVSRALKCPDSKNRLLDPKKTCGRKRGQKNTGDIDQSTLIYITSSGERYTPKKVQQYLRAHYGQTLSHSAASARIKKALKNSDYEDVLLAPNNNAIRPEYKIKIPKVKSEYDRECAKRELAFRALNNPAESEKWAIQDRVLNSY